MKSAEIEGTTLTAFIDMGSDSTIINESKARELKWNWDTNKIKIKGYAGGIGYTVGKVTKKINIDDYTNSCEILIVPNHIQEEGLLVGLNYFNHPDVEVVFGKDRLKIINRSNDAQTKNINHVVLNDVRVGEETSDSDKQRLTNLLERYRECFSDDLSNIGCTPIEEMNITIKEDKIIRRVPYRVPYGMLPEMERAVKELLDAKIIEPSTSEYASPVVMVSKKTGGFRFCVDYRMLNTVIHREQFPTPVIEEELNRLLGKSVFISLDMKSGYHQIKINEQSKHYTAFICPVGHFQYRRCPFGLANSGFIFMRMISIKFFDLSNKMVLFGTWMIY